MITFDQANRLFTYDPITGELRWSENHKDFHGFKPNTISKIAGKPSGCEYRHRNTSYRKTRINGRCYYNHQIAWLLCWEEWPQGLIDHEDGNGLNNRISNLKVVSHHMNQRNMVLTKRRTSQGMVGVYKTKSGTFNVRIGGSKEKSYIGTFKTEQEAIAARKEAESKLGYSKRHGRVTAKD